MRLPYASAIKLSWVPAFCLGLLPLVLPGDAAAQFLSKAWLAESFNNGGSCFVGTVPIDGFGFARALNLSPSPQSGTDVSALCDVVDQFGALHILEFDVYVDFSALGNPSVAKLEGKAPGSGTLDQQLQIFFGARMRVNHFSNSITPPLLPGGGSSFGWHHVRVEIDLNANFFNVYIDGLARAFSLPMQPGPITAVSVTGFQIPGRPGLVRLDNIVGNR